MAATIDTADEFRAPDGSINTCAFVEGNFCWWLGFPCGAYALDRCVLCRKASVSERHTLLVMMANHPDQGHHWAAYANSVLEKTTIKDKVVIEKCWMYFALGVWGGIVLMATLVRMFS